MRTENLQKAPGGAALIVMWRHFPVLFCRGAECRHVYSLVVPEEATRFETPTDAAQAAREYGLRTGDFQIVKF
jgi:hypothetical protein